MTKFIELKAKDLVLNFPQLPAFKTTEDIEPYKSIIGQRRAEKSIELGLKMNKKGYNIFISGHSGTGKTGYIVRKIEEYAKNLPAPEDWCYVYNFEDSNTPLAIPLKTGTANKFKEEMADFIKYLFKEVPIFFNSQNYEKEKNKLIDKYENEIMKLSEYLEEEASKKNFSIKESPTGEFAFIPMIDDKEMDTEDYSKLTQEKKDQVNSTVGELRLLSTEVLKNTRKLSKRMEEELKALDNKIAETIIKQWIAALLENFGFNDKTRRYIDQLKKDIVENIGAFLESEEKEKKDKELEKLFFRRYEVNVLVCNNADKGAPVVFADSAEYGSLLGKVEYENKLGNLITDFSLIKPGCLHQANGGYLIIKAQELLSSPKSWAALKKCLNLEIINIENFKHDIDMLPIITLSPESIPLKVKVILLGSNLLYSLLLERDLEFEKLFKIKAEFDSEIENEENNVFNLVGFLSNYVVQDNLRHITKAGVSELLRYSSRLAESRNYFSASMSKLLQIVDLADYYAEESGLKLIDKEHIKSAMLETEEMHGLIREKILNMYETKKYLVELKGSKVGQINGLSVSNYGDCVVGQQHRITVNTYAGKKGVINIERETEMSGSIHNKGIMILSGFIGELIGQETRIAFNASIGFEQLYSGIEGDSASAAELLALLSSLSDIPLKQSLAITGSVNQKGEIQPIGGVNEKIEGYFDICSIFGLDGSHGVIIPITNVDDLILNDRIIDAVDSGLFHIYAVANIEQCLEILCDHKFTSRAPSKLIREIKDRIIQKLTRYNQILKES